MKGQRHDPSKLRTTQKPPTRVAVLLSSFIASFIGIAIVASLTYNAQWFIDRDVPVIAGSFGASAVLIYGAIESPLSQPRNVFGGHIMSSLIGVSLYKLFNLMSTESFARLHWLLCSLSVSISLFCMQLTHTVHPPASATALIAVTGGPTIYNLGYWYVLSPVALGVGLMMAVAMLVNNIARKYPSHWWNPKTRMVTVVDQDMSTTLADFMPSNDEDEDETREETNSNKDRHGDASGSSKPGDSSRSSTTVNDLIDPNSTLHAGASPIQQGAHHHHHQAQFAVYYGGEQHKELRDGERMQEDSGSSISDKDVEQGRNLEHTKHSSIVIEKRGSPHPSHGTTASDIEYRATIDRLQLRIRELENQLASAGK
ncbi:hypothetical protein BGZ70_010674 [Mortierella alpina]|uniref:HPP transmembrane region domain-containing protein n=1 Tax=Mortierella alpina TaxID=64518 RepID=A0A9P6IYW4_MORAP|nr:hypothetical protein BGZ70_010674 [Mortierella alpina]